MKKTIRFWWLLILQVIALFVGGMLVTYFSDWLQATGFFDDKPCEDRWGIGCGMVDKKFEWGARHYLYFWMMVALFVLSVVRIWMWGDWFWSYNNSKNYDKDDQGS